MKFEDLITKALTVKHGYETLNASRGVAWDGSDYMAGFAGDVGDLSKIIMAKQGLRDMASVDAKLAHELADCLWSIIILADTYDVDLAKEFMKTMSELGARIDASAKN